jgi:hypothetical protein
MIEKLSSKAHSISTIIIKSDLDVTSTSLVTIKKFRITTVNLINSLLHMHINAIKTNKNGNPRTIKKMNMSRSTTRNTIVMYLWVSTSNTKSGPSGSKTRRLQCHKLKGNSRITIKRHTLTSYLKKNSTTNKSRRLILVTNSNNLKFTSLKLMPKSQNSLRAKQLSLPSNLLLVTGNQKKTSRSLRTKHPKSKPNKLKTTHRLS